MYIKSIKIAGSINRNCQSDMKTFIFGILLLTALIQVDLN